MKKFNEFINESNDDLKRSVTGADKFNILDDIKTEKGNTPFNFKAYEEYVNRYPHVLKILETICKTDPRYAIYYIWENGDSIIFEFHQSMGVNMGFNDYAETLKKHKVSIAVPGNQEYTFQISINK